MAITLVVLAAFTTPAIARTAPRAPASASWHGRAIKHPRPLRHRIRAVWPPGWSAGAVGRGSGYSRAGGSPRVREAQRRLRRIGYRPGPVDGLFGPRTEAATVWFQYKHGLPTTGRVDRLTLTVLRARSDHRPIPRAPKPRTTSSTPPATPAAPPPPVDHHTGGAILAAALVLALALLAGLLVGGILSRRQRPRRARRSVVGYVARGGHDAVRASAPALADACTRRDWSLVQIVQEPDDADTGLARRPGLAHALRQIEAGTVQGLMVRALRDFDTRFGDLAVLMKWLSEADGFLAAVDDGLDTSTPAGRATVAAVVDIAHWQRRPIGDDAPELEPRIAALRDRGVPANAIADALNLAGVPAPNDHEGWWPADVAAASRRAQEARSR